jgi:putative aldouronate transport system permease protein
MLLKTKTFGAKIWENRIMWLMLLPAISFIVLFSYVPMSGIIVAFKNYQNRLGIWGSPWAGLENFKYLAVSGKLWSLTRNTMLYNICFIGLGMICETALAIIISELPLRRCKKILQSFTFLPFFISWVVAAAIVMNIFGYENGVLNSILTSAGAGRANIYGDPAKFPIVFVLLRLWKNTGYGAIIYLAAITGMDQQMLEAAEIDGAGIWQRIWYIRGCI